MSKRIALCIDEQSCRNPGLIGLAGENLEIQPWIDLYFDGQSARSGIRCEDDLEEAWVVSCDDVEAINLAATLKADCPELVVRLVDFEGGGSLLSRAHTASIDEVMGKGAFVERYGTTKESARQEGRTPASAGLDSSATAESIHDAAPPCVGGKTPSAEDAEASNALLNLSVKEQPALIQAASTVVPETEAAVQDAVRRLARPTHSPAASSASFVLPVVSGSGGAGKSTISVLGAYLAHSMGYRTLLIDYDLQFGDAALMAGIEKPLAIDEALERPELIDRELKHVERPALLAAPSKLEMAESIAHAVPALLELLSPSFDVIIANTGASWAEQHAALFERSTAVLFLIDQRSSSVRAGRHALDLCARCGIATGQFQFALNRCAKGAPLTSIDVSFALQGATVQELRDGGRDVEDYLSAGAVTELIDSGNELCLSLQRLLAMLLPSTGSEQQQAADAHLHLPGSKRRGRHGVKRKGWGK